MEKRRREADRWVNAVAKRNEKFKLMKRGSIIHLYTSTPPLMCDGKMSQLRGRLKRPCVRGPVTWYGPRGLYMDTEGATISLG
jgi:hypothetical protein